MTEGKCGTSIATLHTVFLRQTMKLFIVDVLEIIIKVIQGHRQCYASLDCLDFLSDTRKVPQVTLIFRQK